MASIHDSGKAFVHRFHNRVALSVGDGSTWYLTREQAHKLSNIINECEENIGECNFTDSSFGSHALPIGGKEE